MYKAIYKYAPLSEYLIDALKNNYYVFSCPSELNDVYDCQLPVNVGIQKDKAYKEIANIISGVSGSINNDEDEEFARTLNNILLTNVKDNEKNYFIKVVKKLVSEQRVTCFSEDFDNMPMWAHYANNHNGVCLKFEYPDDQMSLFSYLAKVNYVEKLPRLKLPNFEDINPREEDYDFINQLLLTKQKKWEYENELRLIFLKDQLKTINSIRSMLNYPPDALTGVYFGYNVDTNGVLYQKIVECCRHKARPPKLHIRRKNEGSFGSYWKKVTEDGGL